MKNARMRTPRSQRKLIQRTAGRCEAVSGDELAITSEQIRRSFTLRRIRVYPAVTIGASLMDGDKSACPASRHESGW
ncbi:hypothetical protein H0178_56325 [Cytobacillus firmus]|nr:hypothetical protein [Cytobacillus firmus]